MLPYRPIYPASKSAAASKPIVSARIMFPLLTRSHLEPPIGFRALAGPSTAIPCISGEY